MLLHVFENLMFQETSCNMREGDNVPVQRRFPPPPRVGGDGRGLRGGRVSLRLPGESQECHQTAQVGTVIKFSQRYSESL